jgi:hypothetical protein
MKHIFLIIIMVAILFSPVKQSVQAQIDAKPVKLRPGVYTGWVFFSARLNSEINVANMHGWGVEYWQSHGEMKIDVDEQGLARTSIVVPVEITLSDYVSIKTSQGDCTASTGSVGTTSYTQPASKSQPLSESFTIPIQLLPELGLSTTTSESYGSMKGCENAAAANGNAMWKAMKATTSLINSLQFQVENQTKMGVNGTCTVPGWEGTTPIVGGQGVRTLEDCKWVVYWVPQSKPQEGWQ